MRDILEELGKIFPPHAFTVEQVSTGSWLLKPNAEVVPQLNGLLVLSPDRETLIDYAMPAIIELQHAKLLQAAELIERLATVMRSSPPIFGLQTGSTSGQLIKNTTSQTFGQAGSGAGNVIELKGGAGGP